MALPASIRVNVRAPFPARVVGASFIAVVKANGVWTIGPNYPALADAASALSTHEFVVYDTVAKTYNLVNFQQFAAYVLSGSRVAVADANYAVASGVGMIAYTALTAARTVSLLPAGDYLAGAQLQIVDESGQGSATNTLTVDPNGSDTINGKASALLTGAYGRLRIESDGVSKWTILEHDLTSMVASLPTILPAAAGVLWNNGGVLCIS